MNLREQPPGTPEEPIRKGLQEDVLYIRATKQATHPRPGPPRAANHAPARRERITGMFKPIVLLGLGVAGVAGLASLSRSQDHAAPGQTARTFAFDRADALKDWTITGDVTIDAARGHQGSHPLRAHAAIAVEGGPEHQRVLSPLLHERGLGGPGSGPEAHARREGLGP